MNCTLNEQLVEASNEVLQGAHHLISDLHLPLNEDTLKQVILLGLALGPCSQRALNGKPTAGDRALMTTLAGVGKGIAFIQQLLESDPGPAVNFCAKGFQTEDSASKPRTPTARKEALPRVAVKEAQTSIVQPRSSTALAFPRELTFVHRVACTFWDDEPLSAGVIVERLALSGWTPQSQNPQQYVSTVLCVRKDLFSRANGRGMYVLTEVGRAKKAETISIVGPNVVTPEGKPLVMPKKVPKGKLPKKIKTR